MTTFLKRLIKKWLDRRGYTICSNQYLPGSVDYCWDIKKLAPALPVEVIFDVGANVGYTALHHVSGFPSAVVYAFEPVKESFDQLRVRTENIRNVRRQQVALGSLAGEGDISLQKCSEWNSLVPEINKGETSVNRRERIRIRTIDEVCREHGVGRIDILKTDTEGYDLEVLKGAEGMITRNKIMFIVSEAGFSDDDFRHTRFAELRNFLRARGFGLYAFYEPAHQGSPPDLYYCNCLFIHRDALGSAGNGQVR